MNVERYRHTQMRTPNVVSRENGLRVHESVSTPAGNKCSELQRHIESLKIRYNSAESTERPEISRRIEELEESRDNCLEELAAARRKERIQDTHAAPSDNGAQPIAWGKTERVREAQAIDAAPEGSLSIVFDRAISFYEDRDIDNALQQLEQAERSAVSTEDKITIIQAYHTIANDLTSLPNALPLAEKLLRKCLAYNDVSGLASPDVASVTYGLLFSVLIGEENYSGLQQEANALLSLVPSISNDPKFSEANAYLHLGMAHEHGGNRSKADEVFEQSRKAANQSRNEELIQSVAGYIERTHRRRANSRSAASASLRSRSSIVAAEDIPSLLSRASITGDQYPAVGARPSLQKTTSALVVIDAATNLMWQTECSSSGLGFFQARDEYVSSLNARRYAGHSDWRLPTLEEAASLVFARGRDFYFALPDEFWTCDRDAHDPKVPERHPGVGGFFKLMFVSGEDNQGSLWIMSNRGRCHTTWWSEHAPFAVACRNV
ncbi:MAG: DUF1566 domain-containing protein [Thiohalocapsa sp. PB-PSB1]|nr:MAG: DUF1566 domain-containing protein [Thiohalocapsa sp. PB-PSB1]HCS91965.1 hypothetical protein [Chromatiaceae bacterium]